jgi:hypothetical protein
MAAEIDMLLNTRRGRSLFVASVLLAAAFAGGGCSSSTGSVVVTAETDARTEIKISGPGRATRGAEAKTTGGDTILKLAGATIVCEGYSGYSGKLGVDRGSLKVGALTIDYDGDEVVVVGPEARGVYTLRQGDTIIASQSGATRVGATK